MGKALSKSARRQMAELFPAFLSDVDREAYANDLVGLREWEMSNKDGSGLLVPQSHLEVSDDFNIKALMESAEDPITGTLRDLRIDDRDMPLAKNFYDFSFNIIGKDSNPPWARQLWTGAMLFGEVCPCCSKKSWLDITNVPKDFKSRDLPEYLQFLEHGKCPKCKRTKAELIVNHNLRGYMELVLVWGQRSGKSESAAFFSAYQTHRFLMFPKLSTLTQALQASTPLTATFVSLTFTKAVSLLWTPLYNKIASSSWFNEYHKMLDYHSTKLGVELYRKKDLFIRYFHKGLHLYPSHPAGNILRGDCLVGSTIVNTSEGFKTFKESISENGFTETSIKVDTPRGVKAASHLYKKQDRELYKLVTKNGFSVTGTPEHPMLVLTPDLNYKWVRMDSICAGDFIVSTTKHNKPMFGTNKLLTKAAATILGTFTANGYRSEVSSDDPQVVKKFYAAVYETTGNYPTKIGRKSTKRATTHYVKLSGKGVKGTFKDQLAAWGYNNAKSGKKEIPLSVRTAPKEILHEYLEAYFACDSGINGGATASKRKAGVTSGVEVEVSSASQKLATQLHIILFHAYGILGRLRKRIELKTMSSGVEKPYTTWILSLSGYDSWLFVQTFKRAKVQRYKDRIKYVEPGVGSDRRSVPYVRALVRELLDASKKSGKLNNGFIQVGAFKVRAGGTAGIVGNFNQSASTISEFVAYRNQPDLMLNTISHLDTNLHNRLTKFFKLGAHYEEVASIKRSIKTADVYDFTVPDGHAFTANCLSSHNTRFLAVVDELGLFPLPKGNDDEDEQSERANSDEAHKSLTNSLTTVQAVSQQLLKKNYNTAPTALMMGVSSPMSERDKVMRLLRESKTEQGSKLILGIQLPTWEVNPYIERDTPIIALAYERNAGKAERDFGANPPRVDSTFMNASLVENGIFVGAPNTHVVKHEFDQVGEIYATLQRVGSVNYPCVLALDAGYSNNAFAIAAVGYDFVTGKTKIPCVLEIIPQQGRVINFNLVYKNVILPLCNDLNVVAVFADRWNSLDLLHRVKDDRGLDKDGKPITASKQYSPKRRHFDFVHQLFKDKSIECPRISSEDQNLVLKFGVENYKVDLLHKPIAHLMLQCVTVKDVNDRLPPEKGDGYTDDMFRAMVLGASLIHEPKVLELLKKAVIVAKQRSGMPMPASAGRSGFGIGHRSIR